MPVEHPETRRVPREQAAGERAGQQRAVAAEHERAAARASHARDGLGERSRGAAQRFDRDDAGRGIALGRTQKSRHVAGVRRAERLGDPGGAQGGRSAFLAAAAARGVERRAEQRPVLGHRAS